MYDCIFNVSSGGVQWSEGRKSREDSNESSRLFGALEGTRIPGPLIKRAYFDGFLYPNSFQNARFDDIFVQLRPVSAPHAFSSCRIFVALFCGTITGTFFISYDKQDFCSHNFGRMGLHGLAALERAFSGGHPALFPDAAPIKISPEWIWRCVVGEASIIVWYEAFSHFTSSNKKLHYFWTLQSGYSYFDFVRISSALKPLASRFFSSLI